MQLDSFVSSWDFSWLQIVSYTVQAVNEKLFFSAFCPKVYWYASWNAASGLSINMVQGLWTDFLHINCLVRFSECISEPFAICVRYSSCRKILRSNCCCIWTVMYKLIGEISYFVLLLKVSEWGVREATERDFYYKVCSYWNEWCAHTYHKWKLHLLDWYCQIKPSWLLGWII